ncbi:MAG: hypothetical protein AAGG02_14500 [Cyanobacteria bacterium P01_H01_bin.15]
MRITDYLASNALNILGITLAVLDFTGIARHVEAGFVAYRAWERDHAQDTLERRNAHLSVDGMKALWSPRATAIRLRDDVFIFGLAALALWLADRFEKLGTLLPDWPDWVWWSLLALGPLIWVGIYMASIYGGMLLGYWRASIAWRFFWLLSRPRAGVLGTIGLLMTFADEGWAMLAPMLAA